jgi:hypothetical protein
MSERAPPGAVGAALIMAAAAALIWALTQLGQKLGMFARDLAGNGATPGQVRTITEQALDRKINGGLDRIIAKLEALEDKVDERHAENQHRFGLLQGQLAARPRGRV